MRPKPMDPKLVREVLDRGDELWESFRRHRGAGFHPFVPADYPGAAHALHGIAQDRGGGAFLELGSGVGVITILAELAGFDAYGIEVDPWLVEASRSLAEELGSGAVFAEGSFIPQDLEVDERLLDADFFPTRMDGADAYAELGLELPDFDVIYGFPWPEEELLLWDLVQRGARAGSSYLTYSGTEGYRTLTVDPGTAGPGDDSGRADSEAPW